MPSSVLDVLHVSSLVSIELKNTLYQFHKLGNPVVILCLVCKIHLNNLYQVISYLIQKCAFKDLNAEKSFVR